jgi:hypothetical protein
MLSLNTLGVVTYNFRSLGLAPIPTKIRRVKEYSLSPNAYDEFLQLAKNPCWGADYFCCLRFLEAAVQFGEACEVQAADTNNQRLGWIVIAIAGCVSIYPVA